METQSRIHSQAQESGRAEANFRLAAGHLLRACGETHVGVQETPQRYAKAMMEMLSGYWDMPENHVKVFENVRSSSMITLKGVQFVSFCEHHLVPFFGTADIGYLPNKESQQVLGLSKLVRILRCFTNRFQVQERIGEDFCDFLNSHMEVDGVICVTKAQHMCMTARGCKSFGTSSNITAIRGAFNEAAVRAEFYSMTA